MIIAHCRSCKAAIVWCKTSTGKNMPIDADFMLRIADVGDDAPEFDYKTHGGGVHWKSCPNADQHRKPK